VSWEVRPGASLEELRDALSGIWHYFGRSAPRDDQVAGPGARQPMRARPLFLEECVRSFVESNSLVGERGAYRLAADASRLRVPASVHAILAARIDRLAPEDKALLQGGGRHREGGAAPPTAHIADCRSRFRLNSPVKNAPLRFCVATSFKFRDPPLHKG
jgi:hypothetical protein